MPFILLCCFLPQLLFPFSVGDLIFNLLFVSGVGEIDFPLALNPCAYDVCACLSAVISIDPVASWSGLPQPSLRIPPFSISLNGKLDRCTRPGIDFGQ